ncbi:hypothetical protein [Oceanobacillus neutriphilus]|uniref:Uncharacterized protein n=1 Tax=Oceanobacillus neutriphilus TaxID=531815 RepID=A0ABQ2NUS2_9BACI|nr:hypothetical protein [Oceanobacillus neutriphilus]GGP11026.1 hypothetical protein GCM10011346_21490 [Oceanobacillus neutriphilus]
MKKYLKLMILITICFFIVSFVLFLVIDSPMPILAALFITWLVFELIFLYFFNKQKKETKLI